jgi:hypothetical protein
MSNAAKRKVMSFRWFFKAFSPQMLAQNSRERQLNLAGAGNWTFVHIFGLELGGSYRLAGLSRGAHATAR